jgi:hypothetical protein
VTYIDQLAAAIRAETPPDRLPDDQDGIDDLFRLYALLALVKGVSVTTRDVHDAWATWMVNRGEGDHESVVPFDELAPEIQAEDEPFAAAIRSTASQCRQPRLD